MPNCFQLIDKTTGQPVILQKLDDKICEHMGVTPDPVKYYRCWFDIIGFKLACGKNFDQIRADLNQLLEEDKDDPDERAFWEDLLKVLDFIVAGYESSAWYESSSFRRD